MHNLKRQFSFGDFPTPVETTINGVSIIEERGISFLRLFSRGFADDDFPKQLLDRLEIPAVPAANRVQHGLISLASISRRERLVFGLEANVRSIQSCFETEFSPEILVVDATHQLATLTIAGETCGELLSSLTHLSFSQNSTKTGDFIRTLFGDVPIIIESVDSSVRFRLIVDQTMDEYCLRMLEGAARDLN